MGVISISDLCFSYPCSEEYVFQHVTLSLDTSWRLGVIGENGSGKTTLLKLLHKKLLAESGTIGISQETSYFPYAVSQADLTVKDFLKESTRGLITLENKLALLKPHSVEYAIALSEYLDRDGYDFEHILQKEIGLMGFSGPILDRPLNSLSGGERTKIKILGMFLKKGSFLLIDEPTNHLDGDGKELLSKYLQRKQGYILTSHDKPFLYATTSHILAIEKGAVTLSKCKFKEWDKNYTLHQDTARREVKTLIKEIKNLQKSAKRVRGWSDKKEKTKGDTLDRGFIGARSAKKMKQAKVLESRNQKKIHVLKDLLENTVQERPIIIKQDRLKTKNYINISNLSFAYENKPLFNNFSFSVNRNDRIWIRGLNGSGKSTLLHIIAGEIDSYTGNYVKAAGLQVSYCRQDLFLKDITVENYRCIHTIPKTIFGIMLNYFRMGPEYYEKPLDILSEGEKKKLELIKVFSSRNQLYLLDEPLNYMDTITQRLLEQSILTYAPTMIFTTHSIPFGEKVATKIINLTGDLI